MVLELVASRMVAQHIGASLSVWTSVIGVILAGICLGNVLGGRLADRVEPRELLGPLLVAGSALTLSALWVNALIGYLPIPTTFPWSLRTLLVVTLDFLIPSTVLGMISPIVAKIAVFQARRSGSAIGDVYFWGAVGSIVGTYLAGFWLINIAPVSTIVTLVAAGLALLAVLLLTTAVDRAIGSVAVILLVLGSLESIDGRLALPGLTVGNVKINLLGLAGHFLVFFLMYRHYNVLRETIPSWLFSRPVPSSQETRTRAPVRSLKDLAILAFIASLAFMSLEMVAGRLVTRHLGSSIYGWTSVIGILLGGLSLGNFLGGKLADRITSEKQASTLFLIASAMVLYVLLTESPPAWWGSRPFWLDIKNESGTPVGGSIGEFLHQPILMTGFSWWYRVLWWTGVVFLVPAISMGTVSPIVAKLAVERARAGTTGAAIGSVYAWGMVGSLIGTFLTGFLLIDVFGTKGVLIILATILAIAATALGSLWHSAWAGIPLGLCVIAFLPSLIPASPPVKTATGQANASTLWKAKSFLTEQAVNWGLREKLSDPQTVDGSLAYLDESNYYFIKVNNEREMDGGLRRTLVLDNLIHGYFVLGKPEELDYDYEHIYALVTQRLMQTKAAGQKLPAANRAELGSLFLGGGSYTFPRYLQAVYPRTWADVAEIDPAVTKANHIALGLPWPAAKLNAPVASKDGQERLILENRVFDLGPAGTPENLENHVKAIGELGPDYRQDPVSGQAVVLIDGEPKELGIFGSEESKRAYLEAVRNWYAGSKYRIRTTWGDARQYVVQHQGRKQFDVVYGDAFNDFSVPWHLTTDEFNKMLGNMLTPEGVYMINIIDVYESDEHAAAQGPFRELEAKLANRFKKVWKGRRSASTMAREVASFLIEPSREPAFAASWGRLATEAQVALNPSEVQGAKELKRLLSQALRQERLLDGPLTLGLGLVADHVGDLNSEEDVLLSMRAVLAKTRSDEVLGALEEVRVQVARKIASNSLDTNAGKMLTKAFETLQTQAYGVTNFEERVAVMLATINKIVQTTRRLSGSPPGVYKDTEETIRTDLVDQYTQQHTSPVSIQAAMDVIEACGIAREQLLPFFKGDEEQSDRRVFQIATQVQSELTLTERFLRARFQETSENEKRDKALVSAAAPEVFKYLKNPDAWVDASVKAILAARETAGFLGAWVKTAQKSFSNVYVFGTASKPGLGERETFVVVASRKPLDVADLGQRQGDPVFFVGNRRSQPQVYSPAHMSALALRSHNVVLTDDYAPVENLLAPVADTRGQE